MKIEQRFLLWMKKTVMLPPMIVRITFERVNCSEVGGRVKSSIVNMLSVSLYGVSR